MKILVVSYKRLCNYLETKELRSVGFLCFSGDLFSYALSLVKRIMWFSKVLVKLIGHFMKISFKSSLDRLFISVSFEN